MLGSRAKSFSLHALSSVVTFMGALFPLGELGPGTAVQRRRSSIFVGSAILLLLVIASLVPQWLLVGSGVSTYDRPAVISFKARFAVVGIVALSAGCAALLASLASFVVDAKRSIGHEELSHLIVYYPRERTDAPLWWTIVVVIGVYVGRLVVFAAAVASARQGAGILQFGASSAPLRGDFGRLLPDGPLSMLVSAINSPLGLQSPDLPSGPWAVTVSIVVGLGQLVLVTFLVGIFHMIIPELQKSVESGASFYGAVSDDAHRAVTEAFDAAVDTYAEYALPQRQLAEKSAEFVGERLEEVVGRKMAAEGSVLRVVDLGCGTGFLALDLLTRINSAVVRRKAPQKVVVEVWLVDLAGSLLRRAEGAVVETSRNWPSLSVIVKSVNDAAEDFARARAERPDIDVVASSGLLQWIPQPARFCKNCVDMVVPGGLITMGTFGSRTLQELYDCYAQVMNRPLATGAEFRSENDLRALLQVTGGGRRAGFWGWTTVETKVEKIEYESVEQLLSVLRKIGVTGGKGRGRLNAIARRQLIDDYEKRFPALPQRADGSEERPIVATWEMVLCAAQRA